MHQIVSIPGAGLALIESEYGQQLWCEVKTRKDTTCVVCKRLIKKGEKAYRPFGNAGNRTDRFCSQHIDQALAFIATQYTEIKIQMLDGESTD